MSFWSPFASLMQAQSSETASRTDALKPLVWPFGISLTACVGLAAADASIAVTAVAAAIAVAFAVLYGFSYVFLLFKQPDALRSERYTLEKMAIERGLVGDSDSGLRRADNSITRLDAPAISALSQTGEPQ